MCKYVKLKTLQPTDDYRLASPVPLQVIQASGSVDLARSVVVPLLTREAIDFLHTSGTAEERHMWVALGDGWTKCRSDHGGVRQQ